MLLFIIFLEPIISTNLYHIVKADQTENNWLTFKNDPSSRSHFEYSNFPPYELLWKDSVGSNPSSVVHEDGKLYLGRMNTLEAYNASTGLRLWSQFLGARASTPAIGEDALYVSTWDTHVFSLDKKNGEIIWEYESEYQLLAEAHHGFFIYPSPKLYGEQLFVGLSDGRMHAINIRDGSLLWSYETSSERHSSVALKYDLAIFGTNGGRSSGRYLYALNIQSGKEVWKKSLGTNIVSTPAIFDDVCYVGSGNKIFALNVFNGATIWSTEINQRNIIESSPAVTEKYVLISGGEWGFTPPKGELYCLSRNNGEILWSTGEYFARSSPSITGDIAVIGEYKPFLKGAKIFAFNITTGEKLWEYEAEAEIFHCNPSFGIERLYLASHDNFIYAFKPAELIVDEVKNPERVDIGTNQSIKFHVKWSHDESDAQNILLKINDDWFYTNSTGWVPVDTSSMESKKITWNISEIKTRSQYKILVNMPTIIWDQVLIEIPQIQRVNLNEGKYTATAYYEYDGEPFIGELIFNETLFKPDVGRYSYKVMGISDEKFGLTRFTANDFQIIFDRVNLETEIIYDRIDLTNEPEIAVSGHYEYDNQIFLGTINMALPLSHEVAGEYPITVESIRDPLYGLIEFTQNEVTCIWDQVVIELALSDQRIDLGEEPNVTYNAHYEYDNQPLVGDVSLDTPAPLTSVGEATYSVESITDNEYGLTAYSVEEKQCIWDRIKIVEGGVSKEESFVKDTETVWFTAEYEYDSEVFDDTKGILYINDEPMTWSPSAQRWEKEVTSDKQQTTTYQISGIQDDKYELSTFHDEVGIQSVKWRQRGIPGFPIHSISIGLVLALLIHWYVVRARKINELYRACGR